MQFWHNEWGVQKHSAASLRVCLFYLHAEDLIWSLIKMTRDIDTQDVFPENKHIRPYIIAPLGCWQAIITHWHFSILSVFANVHVCVCYLVFVFFLFFYLIFYLVGRTVSCFFFCRTRRQLCYQHGISAWHHMSQWHNEIKEVSQACPHCVLDVWKCLLRNFCNLGERYIFKDGVESSVFPQGISVPHTPPRQAVKVRNIPMGSYYF